MGWSVLLQWSCPGRIGVEQRALRWGFCDHSGAIRATSTSPSSLPGFLPPSTAGTAASLFGFFLRYLFLCGLYFLGPASMVVQDERRQLGFVVWCGLLLVKGWEWTSCFWERGRMRWGGDVKGNILWRDLHKILIRSFWHMRSDHLLRLKITVLCCQLPEFLQSRLGRISVQQTMHHYMA